MHKEKFLCFTFFVLFLNLIYIFSPVAQAGVEVSPGKLTIDIRDDFSKENISYKITIKNPYKEDIRVMTKISKPFDLTENFSKIPDLSWVKVKPDSFVVPGKSSKKVEVFVNITDDEKLDFYNKNWEVWAIFIPKKTGSSGTTTLQTQLAVKLLILTPDGSSMDRSKSTFFIWYLVPVFFIFVYISMHIYLKYFKNKNN